MAADGQKRNRGKQAETKTETETFKERMFKLGLMGCHGNMNRKIGQ